MSRYQLVIVDGDVTTLHPVEDYVAACRIWRLITTYGRWDVTAKVQKWTVTGWQDMPDPEPPTGGAA